MNDQNIHHIKPEEIRKLASLARIQVSESDETALASDMQNILGFVKQIQDVEVSETAQQEKVKNVMRDDTSPHESGIHTEAILAEAPDREGDYLKVKKIL